MQGHTTCFSAAQFLVRPRALAGIAPFDGDDQLRGNEYELPSRSSRRRDGALASRPSTATISCEETNTSCQVAAQGAETARWHRALRRRRSAARKRIRAAKSQLKAPRRRAGIAPFDGDDQLRGNEYELPSRSSRRRDGALASRPSTATISCEETNTSCQVAAQGAETARWHRTLRRRRSAARKRIRAAKSQLKAPRRRAGIAPFDGDDQLRGNEYELPSRSSRRRDGALASCPSTATISCEETNTSCQVAAQGAETARWHRALRRRRSAARKRIRAAKSQLKARRRRAGIAPFDGDDQLRGNEYELPSRSSRRRDGALASRPSTATISCEETNTSCQVAAQGAETARWHRALRRRRSAARKRIRAAKSQLKAPRPARWHRALRRPGDDQLRGNEYELPSRSSRRRDGALASRPSTATISCEETNTSCQVAAQGAETARWHRALRRRRSAARKRIRAAKSQLKARRRRAGIAPFDGDDQLRGNEYELPSRSSRRRDGATSGECWSTTRPLLRRDGQGRPPTRTRVGRLGMARSMATGTNPGRAEQGPRVLARRATTRRSTLASPSPTTTRTRSARTPKGNKGRGRRQKWPGLRPLGSAPPWFRMCRIS